MKKLVLWQSGEIEAEEKALGVLAGLYSQIVVVGAVYDLFTTGGHSLLLNGQALHRLEGEDLKQQEFDFILATGKDVEFGKVLKATSELGIDADRVLLNRAVCIPGFTVEKYNQLRHSKLTIFSLACAGGIMTHTMGLPFLSPMVNMWMPWPHFLEFLSHPMEYVQLTPVFDRQEHNSMNGIDYPVYTINGMELHMNHCRIENKEDGLRDWEQRKKRINWFNVMILAGTATQEYAQAFDALPYAKKVCFTGRDFALDSAYYVGNDMDEYPSQAFANEYAWGKHPIYDMWDMMLYGKKTKI